MQCISPLHLNYQGEWFTVDCRKCNFCLQNRRNEWALRLGIHLKHAKSAWVFTLTYNNENVPTEKLGWEKFDYMVLKKNHLVQFTKSLKNFQDREIDRWEKVYRKSKAEKKELKQKWKLKYYGVGEYGSLYNRPHFHIVVYNLWPTAMIRVDFKRLWHYGGVYMDSVDMSAIQYTAKYLIDIGTDANDPRPKPFAIMSKNLGRKYVTTHKRYHKKTRNTYCVLQGVKYRMPRYYKDKIFSKMERQLNARRMKDSVEENFEKQLEEIAQSNNLKTRSKALDVFDDRILNAYEQIRIKSLKQNKL